MYKDMLTDNEFVKNGFLFSILEHGSLTKAARALHISQPALSMKLGKLEESLGLTLIDREKSPVCLTPEGSFHFAVHSFSRICQASVDLLHNEQTRRVCVGGPDVYVNTLVVDAVRRLRELDPDCMVEILNGSQQALISLAEQGQLDFFICTQKRNLTDFFQIETDRIIQCNSFRHRDFCGRCEGGLDLLADGNTGILECFHDHPEIFHIRLGHGIEDISGREAPALLGLLLKFLEQELLHFFCHRHGNHSFPERSVRSGCAFFEVPSVWSSPEAARQGEGQTWTL